MRCPQCDGQTVVAGPGDQGDNCEVRCPLCEGEGETRDVWLHRAPDGRCLAGIVVIEELGWHGTAWGREGFQANFMGVLDLALNLLEYVLAESNHMGPRSAGQRGVAFFDAAWENYKDAAWEFLYPVPEWGGVVRFNDVAEWLRDRARGGEEWTPSGR